jgi:hypothetical protein
VQPCSFAAVAGAIATQTGTAGVAEPIVDWTKSLFASQRLRYVKDPVLCNGLRNADLWRSPQATFANHGGDCEDLSIVGVSALMAFGVQDTWLVVGTAGGEGHAWVEGSDAASGFLVESTMPALVRNARPADYLPSHRFHPAMGAQVFTREGWQPLAA